jgi:peptidoglycan hydrolase-like protein with peptidoglycan-binding domain
VTTPNPNPAVITDQIWAFWLRLSALEPTSELGGIYADKSGYHNTRAGNRAKWPDDYSVRDHEDQLGPDDKAAALDWTFPNAQAGHYSTIMLYSSRLLASGRDMNDERGNVLREFYGNADGNAVVDGWDFRYLVNVSSDSSHLWHIHFSFCRDQVTNPAAMDAVYSILVGESVQAWRARTKPAPAPGPTPAPPPPPPPAPKPVLPTGDEPGARQLQLATPMLHGPDVSFVQKFIGYAWCGAADGYFGPQTREGVARYQRMRGIAVDGIVGHNTWTAMGIRPAV